MTSQCSAIRRESRDCDTVIIPLLRMLRGERLLSICKGLNLLGLSKMENRKVVAEKLSLSISRSEWSGRNIYEYKTEYWEYCVFLVGKFVRYNFCVNI